MTEKILLVDDEPDISDMLEEALGKEGYTNIHKSYSAEDAYKQCKSFEPDIVVLDIMLPDMDGIELCRRIRTFSHCPIIFLSSKNDDVDKILGLASGGDDYVTKPFSPKEVVYRIKSQLRRNAYISNGGDKEEVLQIGRISLHSDACTVYKDDKLLELTAKEYGLLKYMMENAGRIISKERLYEMVWGEESVVCDNTIMVHIRHLREKLEEDASDPRILITVKGLGYKFASGDTL